MSWLKLQWASRKTYWRTLPNIAAWTNGYQSFWFKRSPQVFPTGLGSCFLDASSCRSLISWSFKMISSRCNLRDGLIFGWAACLGHEMQEHATTTCTRSIPFRRPEFFPQIFKLQIFSCKLFLHQHGKVPNCIQLKSTKLDLDSSKFVTKNCQSGSIRNKCANP